MTDERIVGTPHGEARIVAHRARRPVATLALGHGAGAGIESGDLAALAARLPKQDINVFLIEQPWRRAGKKLAPAPKILDEAWIAIIGQLRVRTPLVIGGRSAGARVACRTASGLGASGVLALSFPLHAPGKPEKSRVDELQAAGLPTLVVQGERDPFGTPEEFPPLDRDGRRPGRRPLLQGAEAGGAGSAGDLRPAGRSCVRMGEPRSVRIVVSR